MKIYFSSAHSCGKTTLSRQISQQYQLPMISEVARMVLSEQELQIDTLRVDLEVADRYQNQVFHRQLEEESKYQNFVSDRSAIDTLAYACQHSRILPQLINSPELQSYLLTLQQPDSLIFLIAPHPVTLKSDGVRESLNWDGIISIYAQIKLLYSMFNIRYFSIDTDNMAERLKLVSNVISLKS